MPFIAGGYAVDYGAAASEITVGQVVDVEMEYVHYESPVRGNNSGQSVQDVVYQGMDCFFNFTLLEYDLAGAKDVMWPWDTKTGTMGQMGIIGTLAVGTLVSGYTSIAESLKFSALAGTPAKLATAPAFLQADRTIIAGGFPIRMSFNPELRMIPLRFRSFPIGTPPDDQFFVET